ncbi:MAG: hypothetical protein HY202_02870 [Nitrospirae bacterium]|nr:hypothetical protein [Nitrospirota bacterium]
MGQGTGLQVVDDFIELNFPNLSRLEYQITSPQTPEYNCIAWAACDNTRWWWPANDYFWPEGVERNETLEAFIQAYKTFGFESCQTQLLETGFEKVAIYVDSHGGPTHAARQLRSGKWTSKLGPYKDIEHNSLESLNGKEYGSVGCILKRPIK